MHQIPQTPPPVSRSAGPDAAESAARPLDGLLVADLSRVLAGPTATMMLADLGARVVKVERPAVGDDTRHWGPPWAGSTSSYFESANRSKESVALDFGDEADRALVRELVDRADVVVENFRPGALARFGLDAAAVLARNPRVVYLSISGFGDREGAALPGYDFLVQAVGGLMSITGTASGEPVKAGVALVDLLTAKDAVMGVLAALLHRDRTGAGQHVQVDLMSSLLGSLANQASSFLSTGVAPGRIGNSHPSIAPYDALECRDGRMALAVGNDRQWRMVAEVVGAPALADDPRFRTNADRVLHRAALLGELERRLRTGDVETWVRRLLDAGVPAGKVNDLGEAFALAESLGLAPIVPMGGGHPAQVRHPVRYSGFVPRSPAPPPELDADGGEVREWLAGGEADGRRRDETRSN